MPKGKQRRNGEEKTKKLASSFAFLKWVSRTCQNKAENKSWRRTKNIVSSFGCLKWISAPEEVRTNIFVDHQSTRANGGWLLQSWSLRVRFRIVPAIACAIHVGCLKRRNTPQSKGSSMCFWFWIIILSLKYVLESFSEFVLRFFVAWILVSGCAASVEGVFYNHHGPFRPPGPSWWVRGAKWLKKHWKTWKQPRAPSLGVQF